jgi:glycosyltransferase involved in cell wall biosynthesis
VSKLRILFAHNRYVNRGGEDESREQEMSVLRSRGQRVIEYLVDNREIQKAGVVSLGLGAVWSKIQHEKIRSLIRDWQPDIMKVDNYFPLLSPSIFEAAKSMGVTTILSVRNYRLVCPSANLFKAGEICTNCVGRKVGLAAIKYRCYRGSYLQSTAAVLCNAYGHWRGTWTDSVDQYIAVSDFVKTQLVLGGFAESKISVKPNFIADTGSGDGSGKFFIFVGRLTAEKGIHTLLAAWRKVGARLPLKIIGEGPLEGEVRREVEKSGDIEFLERRSIEEVCDYVGRATALIFPSEWLEPFGRAIVEAFSKGTPVIAADTAPIRDMIRHEQTGLLFRAGDANDLAEKVLSLVDDFERLARMRMHARSRYLQCYSPERNYSQMMEIFERVRSQNRSTE